MLPPAAARGCAGAISPRRGTAHIVRARAHECEYVGGIPGNRDTRAAVVRLVSGGQTGVDRGALDGAIDAGIPHGGYCPRGRRAEDGCIPARYQLTELETPAYPARTEANIVASDGTAILSTKPLMGGTALTARLARARGAPMTLIDLGPLLAAPSDERLLAAAADTLAAFVRAHDIEVLNVAGPRESGAPGAAGATRRLVVRALRPR